MEDNMICFKDQDLCYFLFTILIYGCLPYILYTTNKFANNAHCFLFCLDCNLCENIMESSPIAFSPEASSLQEIPSFVNKILYIPQY